MTEIDRPNLSLRDVHRMTRAPAIDELAKIQSWQELFSDIRSLLEERVSGVLFVHGLPGSGKSTFQRMFANSLLETDRCPVLRGVIADSISQSGWLLNFLSDAIAGQSEIKLAPNEILSRLKDLQQDSNCVVVIIDGMEQIGAKVLLNDIKGLLSLLEGADTHLFFILMMDTKAFEGLETSQFPIDQSVMSRPLPKMQLSEMKQIIEAKVKHLRLETSTLEQLLSSTTVSQEESIGAQLRRLIQDLSEERRPKPSNLNATIKSSTERPIEPRPTKTKNESIGKKEKTVRENIKTYDDFMKPSRTKK